MQHVYRQCHEQTVMWLFHTVLYFFVVIIYLKGFNDPDKFCLSFSLNAPEQQHGQQTLLPVCEVPGYISPEVSVYL